MVAVKETFIYIFVFPDLQIPTNLVLPEKALLTWTYGHYQFYYWRYWLKQILIM